MLEGKIASTRLVSVFSHQGQLKLLTGKFNSDLVRDPNQIEREGEVRRYKQEENYWVRLDLKCCWLERRDSTPGVV